MGKNIELASSDGFKLGAYRADPAGKARGGIVLVQEIFGVNQHIKKVADGYASDGYSVIAPQYFDRVQKNFDVGYAQPDMEAGRGIVGKLDWGNVVKDTQAAINELKSAGKCAVIGYCWGGTVAWLAAVKNDGLACTVAFYGGGVAGMVNEKPKVPVMFHWGEKDHAIPMDAVRKVEAAHPTAISHVYPAGHGFNCDERQSYDAGSAKLARERTVEFLRKHVG
jgi:carboxymethylenebutenolidase